MNLKAISEKFNIEEDKVPSFLATKFTESEQKNFSKFIEELMSSGNITVSSDIPQELRPEQSGNEKDEDDEELKKVSYNIGESSKKKLFRKLK